MTLEKAADPIPLDALRLSHAASAVFCFVEEHPEILREKLDGGWLELVEINREADRKEHPDIFVTDGALWYANRGANILFRSRLQAGELVGCIRDPETGEILRLGTIGWIHDSWGSKSAILPFGSSDDYVVPGDPQFPGPPEAIVRGRLRPVFFLRDEFDEWFTQTFRSKSSPLSLSIPVGQALS